MLFSNKRVHKLSLPASVDDGATPNIKWLIAYLCAHVMKDTREELFVLDGSVYEHCDWF